MSIGNFTDATKPSFVEEGRLWVNGVVNPRASYASTATWSVLTNATLGGYGVFSNTAISVYSGTIDPGTTNVGILAVGGSLTFYGAARLVIDVAGGGSTPSVDFDQLLVGGDLTGLTNVHLVVNVSAKARVRQSPMTIAHAGNNLSGQSFRSTAVAGNASSLIVDTSSGDVVIRLSSLLTGTILMLR
jgi:hypothetical protein